MVACDVTFDPGLITDGIKYNEPISCFDTCVGGSLPVPPAVISRETGPLLEMGGARQTSLIVQELCESRGGRPGLSVLMTSLLVSVDVKNY